MKYNTGNPLGSADPRDLYDTATVADNLVQGEEPAYTDRLGKKRKSWAGMEADFDSDQAQRQSDFDQFLVSSGYELLGDYAAGIEVAAYNQIIRESGEFWRAAANTELPYTTTGAGMPEGGAFVSVGDANLRQELFQPGGALMVNGSVHRVPSRTEMKTYDVSSGYQFSLEEGGRSGTFVVKTGTPPSDPEEGINVVLNNGNYAQRIYDGITPSGGICADWFGAAEGGDASVGTQAALDYMYIRGLGGRLRFSGNDYVFSSGVIVKNGSILTGDGFGSVDTTASQPSNPTTALIGNFVGTLILFEAETDGETIHGAGIDGLTVKGENTLNYGVRARSIRDCYFYFWAERCTVAGFRITDGNNALAANNHIEYYAYQAGSNEACINSIGLDIRDETGSIGTTRTYAEYLNCIGGANGYGVRIGDHDGGYFAKVDVGVQSGGSGYGLLFDGDLGTQPRPSRKNHVGYLNGTVKGNVNSRNSIGYINSEPSDVVLDGNAIIDYFVFDRNDGSRYETFRYAMSDSLSVNPISSVVVTGTPSPAIVGGSAGAGISFADAQDGKIAIPSPLLRKWSEGDIVSIDALIYADGGTAGQDAVLESAVMVKPEAQGFGGGLISSGLMTVDISAVDSIQKVSMTINAPVSNDSECLIVQFSRVGTSGNDTYTGNVVLAGLSVNYVSDGPVTDPGRTWDNPPDRQVLP
ncbi:hypothetical protein ACJO2E_02360 [Marinobacter sp. M1N3S26]|uniref:hypothetical protein n=1 Tax=Marinobacter sp. M1N3S26 TaxID=3382299 RepID=UPI00387B0F94